MPRINGIPVSPRARRLIRSVGAATDRLRGTGPNGRIVINDLENIGQPSAPISQMRLAIARATTEGFSVPHFHLRTEIDATAVLQFRAAHVRGLEESQGLRITVTDIFLKAVGAALKKHPEANSTWREGTIVSSQEANVGVVVSVPNGLLIPVVRSIHRLNLAGLASERLRLVEAARAQRLAAEDRTGAAASLSNLGQARVDEFTAILAPGQTTMLAVGQITERPFVANGQLCVKPTVRLTLTVDHRVLDGQAAAAFLGTIIDGLEAPSRLFSDAVVPR